MIYSVMTEMKAIPLILRLRIKMSLVRLFIQPMKFWNMPLIYSNFCWEQMHQRQIMTLMATEFPTALI